MKLSYAILCTVLATAGAYAGEAERAPSLTTHPAPPASTRCPPASTQPPPAGSTQPPPAHARQPAHRPPPVQPNPDEKVIPGEEPRRPRPDEPLPPPPCG